jgi:gliding motility-associated protein GldM
MAGYKETPRQKMIAMMYLVLTALLALNVSKQILDAFLVVNESMESTNESLSVKIDDAYAKFEQQYTLNKDKVGPFYTKAKNIQKNANELVDYLEDLKFQLVKVSERKEDQQIMDLFYKDTVINNVKKKYLDLNSVPTKDKYDATTFYMVKERGTGAAYTLSAKMQDFRLIILEAMNLPESSTKIGLITNEGGIVYRNADGQKQNWEEHNFYHTILAADITILNKIITEVKSAEFNALNYLYSSVSEKDFKFDNVTAKVIPKSTYVFKGQNYEAEVLVAAYDTKTKPSVKVLAGASEINSGNIGRAQSIEGDAGTVKLNFGSGAEGPQKYAGVIEMIDPATNQLVTYPFSGEYIVAPPALTVAPLKMNVLYIGVDNPVAISAPGLPAEKINARIDQGTLTKSGKDYSVKIASMPKGVTKATISATADIDGKMMQLGAAEFRVKRVPSPTAEVAGQTDGQIDKNTLLAAGAIIPNMKDFEFDLFFEVTSFTFATFVNGDWIPKNVKGNRFTQEILDVIRNGKRDQKFFFENIQAKGPDGTTRSLNPVNLQIK